MKEFIFLMCLMLFFSETSEDMCCENCTDEGTKKYYSIDTTHDRCGECCMAPENFTIFKRFETGLTEATVAHPCSELGYTEYEITETHGAAGYYMTLDKYKKQDICCENCTDEGTKKYYSIDTAHDRCGECCMAPENFTIFKRFETGLTEATVAHPCSELGYTEYEITETHGAAGYYMTLDKYKKQDMCCENCTDEGTKKYYSIDTTHDRCGECCMAPENFTIFKRFETGLTEATVAHPCSELGYTEYEITETHGAAGYYMTLDKYKKQDMCCENCTDEGTKKYYSIDTTHDRCGECCMAPENFTIFKRFETGLTEATVAHPCSELGYTEYEITETHGAAGYYMTLDKYKKLESSDNSTNDEESLNHVGYFRTQSSKGLKGGHIAAIVLSCVAVVAGVAITIGVTKGLSSGSTGEISKVSVDNSSSINKLNYNK